MFHVLDVPFATTSVNRPSWGSLIAGRAYDEPTVQVNSNQSPYSTIDELVEPQNPTLPNRARADLSMPQEVVQELYSASSVESNAVPIQTWEGCVQHVDFQKNTMTATLNAKIGVLPEHVAEIDLQWVSEQDYEILEPGAVFYLTLFKRVLNRGGSKENAQSIQFRRRPNWSKKQLENISIRAGKLLSKMESKPLAD